MDSINTNYTQDDGVTIIIENGHVYFPYNE